MLSDLTWNNLEYLYCIYIYKNLQIYFLIKTFFYITQLKISFSI